MWDADLQRAGLWDTDLRGVKLAGAQLQRANLMDADLRGARLESAHLQDAHLEKAQLQGASLWGAELQGTHLADAQLQALDLSLCDLGHAFFCDARLDRTRLRWEQLGGAIGEELAARDKRRTTEERMRLFGEATRGYLVLKRNFDDLGDYDAASKAYRKERRMEKCEAWQRAKVALAKRDWFGAIRSGFKAFGDHLVECVCDYGESWRRVVAWMIFMLLILGPALSMALGNLYWMGENYHIYYDYTSPVSRALYSYGQHVLYALDAFTTASFAELKPGTDCVRLVSGLIAMAGIILAGLLGFVAGNRIRRS